MENEIKVNEYARDDFGNLFVVIGKYERGQFGEICVQLGDFKTKEFAGEQWEKDIKIGKLIDLIKVGDVIKIHNLKGDDISFWFEIFDNKTMMDFKLGLDDKEIEILEVVTKEMMKYISYKVKE